MREGVRKREAEAFSLADREQCRGADWLAPRCSAAPAVVAAAEGGDTDLDL